jgi:cystathionine beta-lyase/cystathionine gamma-synthase
VHHPALSQSVRGGLRGTSGLFSIELGRAVDIPAFCDALRLFKLGVSWGGHESLVCPAGVTRVQVGGPNHAVRFNVPERMVRLSIGLESPEALWADLAQALAASRVKGRKSA